MIKDMLIAGVVLAVVGVAGLGGLVHMYTLSLEQNRANEQRALAREIQDVIPDDAYDNEPMTDRLDVRSSRLGSVTEMPVYRARLQGEPSAVVVSTMAMESEGNGRGLLVGIHADGTVAGLRPMPNPAQAESAVQTQEMTAMAEQWTLALRGLTVDRLGADGRIRPAEDGDETPDDAETAEADDSATDDDTGLDEQDVPASVVKAVRAVLIFVEQHGDTLFANPEAEQEDVAEGDDQGA